MEKKFSLDHTKEVLSLVSQVALFIASSVKDGFKTPNIFKILTMLSQLKEVSKDVPLVIPELKDMDLSEYQELCAILFNMAKDIHDIVKK